MTRTMVANVPGARLREIEKELATLRGADAVSQYIDEHPTETKVLQQMVELRRAGKPTPSLARVQRAMLWSDGTIEFSAAPAPPDAGRRGRGERGERGDRGVRPASRAGIGPPTARSEGAPTGASASRSGDRRTGPSGFSGRPGGSGGRPRSYGGGSSYGGSSYGGRASGRRDRTEDEGGYRSVPRSGEGWTLYRAGERPPEQDPVEYAVNGPTEDTAEAPSPQASTAAGTHAEEHPAGAAATAATAATTGTAQHAEPAPVSG